ncbi:helicase [Soybean leaf crinkle mottle virus]|nr:helicase [Soybean leaf crinkle mottle virus]
MAYSMASLYSFVHALFHLYIAELTTDSFKSRATRSAIQKYLSDSSSDDAQVAVPHVSEDRFASALLLLTNLFVSVVPRSIRFGANITFSSQFVGDLLGRPICDFVENCEVKFGGFAARFSLPSSVVDQFFLRIPSLFCDTFDSVSVPISSLPLQFDRILRLSSTYVSASTVTKNSLGTFVSNVCSAKPSLSPFLSASGSDRNTPLEVSNSTILTFSNRTETKFLVVSSKFGVLGTSNVGGLTTTPNDHPVLVKNVGGTKYQLYKASYPRRLPLGDCKGEKKQKKIRNKLESIKFKRGDYKKKETQSGVPSKPKHNKTNEIPFLFFGSIQSKLRMDEISPVHTADVTNVVTEPTKHQDSLVLTKPAPDLTQVAVKRTPVNRSFPELPKSKLTSFKFPKNTRRGFYKHPNTVITKTSPYSATTNTFLFKPKKSALLNGDTVQSLEKIYLGLKKFSPSQGMVYFDHFTNSLKDSFFVKVIKSTLAEVILVRSDGSSYICYFSCSQMYSEMSLFYRRGVLPVTCFKSYTPPSGKCYLNHILYLSMCYRRVFDPVGADLGSFPLAPDFRKLCVETFGKSSLAYPIYGKFMMKNTFHCDNLSSTGFSIRRMSWAIGGETPTEKYIELTDAMKHEGIERVLSKLGGRDSLLGMSCEKDLITFKNEQYSYRQEKEEIRVPFYMSESIQTNLVKNYPQFNLKFTHSSHSDHPAAAASRLLENYTLSRICVKNFSDIGGCPLFHTSDGKSGGVHVCRPVYDSKDAQRKVLREHQLSRMVKKMETAKLIEAPSRLSFCHKPLGECEVKSDSLILVQVYDATLEDIFKSMLIKHASVAYLTMVSPGEILDEREVFYCADLDCEISINKPTDKITYKFGTSCYTHSLSNITNIMKTPLSVYKGHLFSIECSDCRMGVNYYKITKSEISPDMICTKTLRYKRVQNELYKVRLPRFNRKKKVCVPGYDYIYLDEKFVSRVYEYVVANCSVVNSKTFEWVWSFIKSSKSRVVVSGKVIHRDVHLDLKYLENFSAVMLAAGVKSRLASEQLAENLHYLSGDAGIIESVMFAIREKLSCYLDSFGEYLRNLIKKVLNYGMEISFIDLEGALERVTDYHEFDVPINVVGFGKIDEEAETSAYLKRLEEAIAANTAGEVIESHIADRRVDAKTGFYTPPCHRKGGLRGGISYDFNILRTILDNAVRLKLSPDIVRSYLSYENLIKFLGSMFGRVSSTVSSVLTHFVTHCLNFGGSLKHFLDKFVKLIGSISSFVSNCNEPKLLESLLVAFWDCTAGSLIKNTKAQFKVVINSVLRLVAVVKLRVTECKLVKFLDRYLSSWCEGIFSDDLTCISIETIVSAATYAIVYALNLGTKNISGVQFVTTVLRCMGVELNLRFLKSEHLGNGASTVDEYLFYKNLFMGVTVGFSGLGFYTSLVVGSGLVPNILRRICTHFISSESSLYVGYIKCGLHDLSTLITLKKKIRSMIRDVVAMFLKEEFARFSSSVKLKSGKKVCELKQLVQLTILNCFNKVRSFFPETKLSLSQHTPDDETEYYSAEEEFPGVLGKYAEIRRHIRDKVADSCFKVQQSIGDVVSNVRKLKNFTTPYSESDNAKLMSAFIRLQEMSDEIDEELDCVLVDPTEDYDSDYSDFEDELTLLRHEKRGGLRGGSNSSFSLVRVAVKTLKYLVKCVWKVATYDIPFSNFLLKVASESNGFTNASTVFSLVCEPLRTCSFEIILNYGIIKQYLIETGGCLMCFGFYRSAAVVHGCLMRMDEIENSSVIVGLKFLISQLRRTFRNLTSKCFDATKGVHKFKSVSSVGNSSKAHIAGNSVSGTYDDANRLRLELEVAVEDFLQEKTRDVYKMLKPVDSTNKAELITTPEEVPSSSGIIQEFNVDKIEVGESSSLCLTFKPEDCERAVLSGDVCENLKLENTIITPADTISVPRRKMLRNPRSSNFLFMLNKNGEQPVPFVVTKSAYTNAVREFYYLQEVTCFEIYNKLSRYYDELSVSDFNRKVVNCGNDADLYVHDVTTGVVSGKEGRVALKTFDDHEYCFSSSGLVKYDESQKRVSKLFHNQTKFLACDLFLLGNPFYRSFEFSNRDIDVLLYEAPPGGGKTYSLIELFMKHYGEKDILVLTANKSSREEILKKINVALGKSTKNLPLADGKVLTIDSYLMNHRGLRCDLLFIDECFMVHAGGVLACMEFTKAKKCLMFGDSRQIHYIERNEYEAALYSDLDKFIAPEARVYGDISYRCPWDVCVWLSDNYPNLIRSTNVSSEGKSSMNIKEIECVEDVPVSDDYVYLTFLQSEKKELEKYLKKNNCKSFVKTVHETQGDTHSKVMLVRTKFQEDDPFRSFNHINVAISRHTESLTYAVLSARRNDDICEAINRSKALVDKFRVNPTTFSGSVLDINVNQVFPDNTTCKATSAPVGVINDFLNEVVPGSATIDFGDLSSDLSSQPFESGADHVVIRDSAKPGGITDHDEQRV